MPSVSDGNDGFVRSADECLFGDEIYYDLEERNYIVASMQEQEDEEVQEAGA